jgi:hypothetical protein
MTKLEFMKELESLLPDIPSEERDEALQYYNGYYDDAGEDQEQEIIKELGSPARVASIIKADLNPDATDRENRGYFTEKGYQETISNEYEIVNAARKETNNSNQTNAGGNSQTANGSYTNGPSANGSSANGSSANGSSANGPYANGPYANGQYTNGPYANGSYTNRTYTNGTYTAGSGANAGQSAYKSQNQTSKSSNTGLIVVVALLTFPFWLPLLLSAIGIAIGVIAAILGIIFGFGVAGITMIGVGVAMFIAGLVQLTAPLFGLLLIGIGLIVFGTGMLLTLACVALCKNVLPAMIRGIVNLCRLPFKNRSVMA